MKTILTNPNDGYPVIVHLPIERIQLSNIEGFTVHSDGFVGYEPPENLANSVIAYAIEEGGEYKNPETEPFEALPLITIFNDGTVVDLVFYAIRGQLIRERKTPEVLDNIRRYFSTQE